MGSEIWKPNHFKSGQMAAILSKNHLKSRQKCPYFEWSSFRIVGTTAIAIAKARPFENRPSKSPDFKYWLNLLVKNKGRHVTLKYFCILIKIDKEHRLFIGPGQIITLIFIKIDQEV